MAEEKEEKAVEKKEEEKGSVVYEIILGSLRLFVFLYILVFALYIAGFDVLEGLVSVIGAVLLFGTSIVAIAMEKL